MKLDRSEIKKIFKSTLKGSNMMTSTIIGYGILYDNFVYELSTGEGFDRKEIYGVTVLEVLESGQAERRSDKSKLFKTRSQVEEYLAD